MSPLARARLSLEGLSLGDAFGMHLDFEASDRPGARRLLPGSREPWAYTDDTEMALSIYAELALHGGVDPDALAASFARRFTYARGYGGGASRLLQALRDGGSWRTLSPRQHGGAGSCGNGGAMRVAPLGAFFADDPPALRRHAELSCRVTHSHPEGVAGAVAVAQAAALACRLRDAETRPPAATFLEDVASLTPPGDVRRGLERASQLDGASVAAVVEELGNGSNLLAADTVPFALWSAAVHLHDYAEALIATGSGLGDADTTCAIAGGVVACFTGRAGLPADWLRRREPLPTWIDAPGSTGSRR